MKVKEPTLNPIRTGGHRSLEILQELADIRSRAVGTQRASRAVSDLNWQRAQSYAIQRDDFRTVWHAGHVNALLTNDVDVIAATQTGGVWLLKKSIEGPTALAGYTGISLSDEWDAPDYCSLAWGLESTQVFVGTTASAIFLLEFDTALGGHLSVKQSTILPVPFAGTGNIVTLANPNRIVVIAGGSVWWSPIPRRATNLSGYDWQRAQGLPGFATYSGLAAGPGASVAVAKYGGSSLPSGQPPPGGVYRGTFQADTLVFAESKIEGVNLNLMRRTSLASCEDRREHMYGVLAGADDMILAVISSDDGGATWRARATPDKAAAGLRGFYGNCITVSPQRPELVVIGWLSGGPFLSDNGARSWQHLNTQESNSHLHNDLHAVYLGRNPNGPEPLYVGGDGGIVVTRDFGQTYHSQFNRPLNNLQFYGARPSLLGSYAGSLTASSRYPGLLAGGTQDNGNVYRCPDTRREGVPRQADAPWLRQVGGDGDLNRFVDPLGVLLNFSNDADKDGVLQAKLRMALWDEQGNRFPTGTVIPASDNPAGIRPTSVEVVQKPTFRRNGQLMYAAVGSASDGVIHGVFAADPVGEHPDARDVKLIRLGTVGSRVSSIGSMDGSTLMIGTENGRILSFDSASGAIHQYALPDIAKGVVSRIEVFPPPPLGGLPDNAYALIDGRILRFNGLFWATTTGTDWTAFTLDTPSGRLFAATDGDVFVSNDRGLTWSDASAGLPMRPHCSDLRIAADGKGGRDLYLSTYGHSVWRATIAQRSEIFDLPTEAVEILIGVIEDGGGVVRLGKRFVKLPPQPLVRDLLVALVIDNLAQSMSEDSEMNARAIRQTAWQQIAQIALREVDRLG